MKLIGYPAFRPLGRRRRSGLIMSLAVFVFVLGVCGTAQDRRIVPVPIARKQALVIANADYRLSPLKNPLNDGAAMQAALKAPGFEVTLKQNLDLAQMEEAIDEFTANVAPKSFAFVYFSGHGIQVKANNYLIPVDFNASTEADVKYKSYAASRLQEKLEETGASLRVIVLDACRALT